MERKTDQVSKPTKPTKPANHAEADTVGSVVSREFPAHLCVESLPVQTLTEHGFKTGGLKE